MASTSNLDNLVTTGELHLEPGSRVEFDGLVQSGANRIADAETESLNLESRFDLAYNAAHAFALAALRYWGYRPNKKRYIVFLCLQTTLQMAPAQWRVLDQAHKKRNLAEYEGNVDIDLKLVEGVIDIAREMQKRLLALTPLDG